MSEPGGHIIDDQWQLNFNTYLAGTLKMAVLEIDGRGSAGRGEDWLRLLINKIGDIGVEDQLSGLK